MRLVRGWEIAVECRRGEVDTTFRRSVVPPVRLRAIDSMKLSIEFCVM